MAKMTEQEQINDIAALLRARHPLIWIVTPEEARVEVCLARAAASAKYVARTWDTAQGVADIITGKIDNSAGGPDIDGTLQIIEQRAKFGVDRGVWVLRDLTPWVTGAIGISTSRRLRNLVRLLPTVPRDRGQAIVVLSTTSDIPPELSGHAAVIEWPLPGRDEIGGLLDCAVETVPDDMRSSVLPDGGRDAAIDAAVGLTAEEAQNAFAQSLVKLRRIDPGAVAKEKKRTIARAGVLEWYDPLPGGLDAVGGLDALKSWLVSRRSAYTPAARAYGLPSPKGALIVGIPGTGKSLVAKAVATSWNVPLLRLDLGSLRSKYVGESEGNIRKALRVIEAIGRCVVWLDEIEKAMAGATQGAADGGVSADALGSLLSWMQERAGEAFIIATANDVSSLPPELMRVGRFDKIFWNDLPNVIERADICRVTLKANGRSNSDIDVDRIALATDGFTGAEIASVVPEAMFVAFDDGQREITTNDLLEQVKRVTPLSKSMAEKIASMRSWATGRTTPTTYPLPNEQAALLPVGREVEL